MAAQSPHTSRGFLPGASPPRAAGPSSNGALGTWDLPKRGHSGKVPVPFPCLSWLPKRWSGSRPDQFSNSQCDANRFGTSNHAKTSGFLLWCQHELGFLPRSLT